MTVTAQRLWLWLFSMAFVLLSGFNGYRLVDLEGSSWAGEPVAVRTLRAQLDRLSAGQEPAPLLEWHETYEAEAQDAGPSVDAGRTRDASANPDAGTVVPPVLTGIVSVLNAEGHTVFSALLDGQMRGSGQWVGDFRIIRISERGVLLRHKGGELFLPSRDPIFSIDHGNGPLNP